MKKPKAKRLTAIEKVRRQLRAARQACKIITNQLVEMSSRLKAEVDNSIRLTTQLEEARRRTVPCDFGGELNFLPLGIEKLEWKHDHREIESMSGRREVVLGSAHMIIFARGDITHHLDVPGGVTKNVRAADKTEGS
jgi:hypothetical protein